MRICIFINVYYIIYLLSVTLIVQNYVYITIVILLLLLLSINHYINCVYQLTINYLKVPGQRPLFWRLCKPNQITELV